MFALIGIIVAVVGITFMIAMIFQKKIASKNPILLVIPGLITTAIICAVLIPYGMKYPDPLGTGLVYVFTGIMGCVAIAESVIVSKKLAEKK